MALTRNPKLSLPAFKEVAMVNAPIGQRRGHPGSTEHFGPFIMANVGGEAGNRARAEFASQEARQRPIRV